MTAVVECSREAAFSENECEGRAPVQLVQCSTVYSDAAGSAYNYVQVTHATHPSPDAID